MKVVKSSKSLLPAWSYLAFAVVILSVFFYLDFSTICTETKDLKLASLRSLILYNCIGFTAIIILVNVWSIAQIHEYLRKNSEKIKSEKELPCDYCLKSPAGPLICSNCNSILWGRIDCTLTDVAVFIAQHRWSVITGVFALFLIAPMSFIYTKIKEREKDKTDLIGRATRFIDSQNEFRSLVSDYELSCKTGEINTEKLSKLATLHKQFTWELPRLINDISKMLDEPLTINNQPDSSTSSFDFARFVNSIIVAGNKEIINKKDTIKITGTPQPRWSNYLLIVYKFSKSPGDTSLLRQRREIAYDLDTEFRITNAVIGEFINQLEDPNSNSKENVTVFKEVFGGVKGKELKELENIERIDTSTYLSPPHIRDTFQVNEYPIMIKKPEK